MSEIETFLTHDGVKYAATIVTIESTSLGREDHGIWQAMLYVGWGGCGTGVGGFALDGQPNRNVPPGDKRTPTAYGLQWIIEATETVCGECGRWESLPGKQCFMLHDADSGPYDRAGFNCKGIASLDGKRVMVFDDVAAHAGEQ
ncbi:hypothetical protein [Mycobacterium sp. CnD-18-1]|uniref:hypothetical protein n=1 Tax=Mycobacterium sp. CnD-18-1 TaxID=2917744 RepID=UPI001EF33A30|nr:hypothetical protein [Mycobacterium sp. CnD-18-1]MCG7607178.1 hypothetical protein [Mycobacterium sp. CnD-18-1]